MQSSEYALIIRNLLKWYILILNVANVSNVIYVDRLRACLVFDLLTQCHSTEN